MSDKQTNEDFQLLLKIKFYMEALARITEGVNFQGFVIEEEKNFSVAFSLIQIGEAANKISKEFCEQHKHIPWRDIAGVRHRVVHNYEGSNPKTLWEAATISIPELYDDIVALMR